MMSFFFLCSSFYSSFLTHFGRTIVIGPKTGAMLKTSSLLLLVTTFLLLLFFTVNADGSSQKTQLSVGYLTAVKGDLKDRQGLSISGAILLALEEINNDTNLLPNVTLNLRWNDTRGETVASTRAITEMICDGVSTIFGPEGTCHTEAIVAQSRNIPMISYVSHSSIRSIFVTLNVVLFSHSFRDVLIIKLQQFQHSQELNHLILK